MLQQILNDMYIEPELLAELDEEQKQILFCKMREEQVRRWREREEKLQNEEENNRITSRKKKDGGKKVTFLMGVDGEPMVVVLGGEGGTQREDVDSILEERAKRQADLEADMLKRAAEEELDKLVRLSRSTVEAMEEEATRTSNNKVRDPAREAVVRSLQEATVEMEGQIQALEEAEAYQRKFSSSSSSSSSSGASSPSSPFPSSSSSSSSSSSGIGSIGSPRLALSSSPSTSSLSSLSSFTSSQPPSPPAFTISAYGSSTTSSTTTTRRLGGGSGVSMWDAVNRASHLPSSSSTSSSTSSSSSSASSVLSSSNFSSIVKPPILTPKPITVPPPQPLRASQPSVSPPSSLSSTTSTFSSSSSTSTSSSAPPSSAAETVQVSSSPSSSVVGVAAQIRRFEQLSEGSLEALKTATLERAKKRREREIFEHLRSQVEAARLQAASADLEAASRQQQAAEKDDIAWQEQERKAKEAERRIREIARRAREEHRRASQNTPPASPPASALNYNLNGLTRLTNGINGAAHATTTPPAGDINGNVNSVADDISNNNDSISLKKYSSSSSCSSSSSLGSPGVEGFCIRQRLRPPKPPSRSAIITWFRDEELPRGAGLDPSCSRIASWFHGIISRTEAEEVLSEAGIGCFLVRVSERIWGYAISYRAPDRCRHYLIDVTGGKYTFFGSHQASHDSLGDLIENHKREPITVSGGELLTRPCGQMHPRNPDYQELFIGTPYLAA